jgi:PAS domain S-box-containing protein
MKPILIIAPHRQILESSIKIAEAADDIEVVHGLLEDAVGIAGEGERRGAEVIVSRGGTARIIEASDVNLPIVDIPVSPYELLQAVHAAKQFGSNITVLGFSNIIQGVDAVSHILDLNVTTYTIHDYNDGENVFQRVARSGARIDALLGGTVAELLAEKYGIPTVPLETSPVTLEASVREARRLLTATRREKEKTNQVQAILNNISEGIIAVNRRGRITIFNKSAVGITGIAGGPLSGEYVDEVIPNTRLLEVIESSEPELGQLQRIGSSTVLTNRVPVVVEGRTVGAVATFADVTKIQEYEQRIRGKLREQGHVARLRLEDIKGSSRAIRQAKQDAQKYAGVDSTVLIEGESGTGKEMFAQGIHQLSPRNNGPFVAVNCAAISHSLMESELFGYEKGAYTGAHKDGKTGLFVEANKGTIFLDEVSEINPDIQARLLRVLQEREVRPLGSNKVIPIDVRIIAATNRTLAEEVRKGAFRSDLFYRLNILKLKVPPLRLRDSDCRELVGHFLDKHSRQQGRRITIAGDALKLLLRYDWPGNIRELENMVERLVVLVDGEIGRCDVERCLDDLSEAVTCSGETIGEIRRDHILKILDECGGNKTRTSERLGISRTHLWRLLKSME